MLLTHWPLHWYIDVNQEEKKTGFLIWPRLNEASNAFSRLSKYPQRPDGHVWRMWEKVSVKLAIHHHVWQVWHVYKESKDLWSHSYIETCSQLCIWYASQRYRRRDGPTLVNCARNSGLAYCTDENYITLVLASQHCAALGARSSEL